ncbi:MAG: cadherin domain-containing protein [Verrucomicrobiota bacterium]
MTGPIVHGNPELQAIVLDALASQAYVKASNPGTDDFFGFAVAISGDTLVIGAHREDSASTGINGNQTNGNAADAGAVYVFVRANGTWRQQAYLKASNTDPGDNFGYAVAVSGDTIVVGARWEDALATGVNSSGQIGNGAPDAGAAYVFVRTGETWTQQAYLKASNTDAGDNFGNSVAISGNTIVVGAPGEGSTATGINGNQSDDTGFATGAAYVFVRTGSSWRQQAYLKASNTGDGDSFGASVAISGDSVVVSAPGERSNATGVNGDQSDNSAPSSGAAYVFVRQDEIWRQQAYLKASNTGANDSFGAAVAIDGNTAVIAASREDSNAVGVNGNQSNDNAQDAGAAYVFVRSGEIWSQQAYLKASNTEPTDFFGFAIALSGDRVVIGAYQEDSNATGIGGDENDNNASSSGAAYVFMRGNESWRQESYLKSSNSEANDRFGYAVALTGHTTVVSSYAEDSAAAGINGDQTDNSLANSGAVYVFVSRSAPTDIQLSNSSIPENQPAGSAVGSFTAIDSDAADTHTFTLVAGEGGADNHLFTIEGNVLKTDASFDFETKNSFQVLIQAVDSGNLAFQKQFTILVSDVAELPVITSISPESGEQGTTLAATISGENLQGATAVILSGTGITAAIATGGTGTSLPITLTISNDAETGLRTLTVSTAVGNSTPFSGFTVLPAPAALQSIITTVAGSGASTFSGDGGAAFSAGLRNPSRVAFDAQGNLFIADSSNQRIRKVTPHGLISTVAGTGTAGATGDGGPAIEARLSNPYGVAVDRLGNLLIADRNNHRIRKVTPDGRISTLAGTGSSGSSGDGGPATAARLNMPADVAVDAAGNVFVADRSNHRIRKISLEGIISTVAGTGLSGFSGDGESAIAARLNVPLGVAVDAAGNLFIADQGNSRVRKVANGIISTVAGNGTSGFTGDGGPATEAAIRQPTDLVVDPAGNLFIALASEHRIRKVGTDGIIQTIVGTGTVGFSGDGGLATAAELNTPLGISIDAAGNLLIADSSNNRIRKVTSLPTTSAAPRITALAPLEANRQSLIAAELTGTGLLGATSIAFSGAGVSASLGVGGTDTWLPFTVTIEPGAELGLRTITVTTPFGTSAEFSGLTVKPALPVITSITPDSGPQGRIINATINGEHLSGATAVAITGSGVVITLGNGGSDTALPVEIRIAPEAELGSRSITVTTAGGTSLAFSGFTIAPALPAVTSINPASGRQGTTFPAVLTGDYLGDALRVTFSGIGVTAAIDSGGTGTASTLPVLITIAAGAPVGPRTLTVTTAAGTSDPMGEFAVTAGGAGELVGVISTVAGNGTSGSSGDNGPAIAAQLQSPPGIAVDHEGNLFIADRHRIRKVTNDGMIKTVAGNGQYDPTLVEDGPATSVIVASPHSVAVDKNGALYISQSEHHRVRVVRSDGIIRTLAGTGVRGLSGDDAAAIAAQLNGPQGLVVDAAGHLYIADYGNHRVRKVTLDGIISTVAGTGTAGAAGDGGPAVAAQLTNPRDLVLDSAGNLFIATSNHAIRRVDTQGIITTVAGSGIVGFQGDGGPATNARLNLPDGVALDAAGNLFIADYYNNRIRKVAPDGMISTLAGIGPEGRAGGFNGDGGPAEDAQLNWPTSVAVDPAGSVYIADGSNHRIRKVTFQIIGSTIPVVTAISPANCRQGISISAIISGTALNGATSVTFSGSGVNAIIESGGTETTLPVTITVSLDAPTGLRTVKVNTPEGQSQAFSGFLVKPAAPEVTSISQTFAAQGATISAVITGTQLSGASAVTFTGGGVTATIELGGTETRLPITISVAADAAPGVRSLVVTSPLGNSEPFAGLNVQWSGGAGTSMTLQALAGDWNFVAFGAPTALRETYRHRSTGDIRLAESPRADEELFDLSFYGSYDVTSGSFSMTSEGIISGNMSATARLTAAGTLEIAEPDGGPSEFLFNPAGDVLTATRLIEDGEQEIAVAVRKPADPRTSDLQGTWHFVNFGTPSDLARTYYDWDTRKIRFSPVSTGEPLRSNEKLVDVFYSEEFGTQSGTVNITATGQVTGDVTGSASAFPDGRVILNIGAGGETFYLNAAKDFMVRVRRNAGENHLTAIIKQPANTTLEGIAGSWRIAQLTLPNRLREIYFNRVTQQIRISEDSLDHNQTNEEMIDLFFAAASMIRSGPVQIVNDGGVTGAMTGSLRLLSAGTIGLVIDGEETSAYINATHDMIWGVRSEQDVQHFLTLVRDSEPAIEVSIDPKSISRVDGVFKFGWATVLGRKYQIQFKERLDDVVWSNLGEPRIAEGTIMFGTDPSAGVTTRFYRVKVE